MTQIKKPIILKPDGSDFYIKEDNSFWFKDDVKEWYSTAKKRHISKWRKLRQDGNEMVSPKENG